MNSETRDGGLCAPSPGRRPRGARKKEMKPASSSIPSDWYEEKSCSAAMQERKSTVHTATIQRGAMLNTNRIDAVIPKLMTTVCAGSDAFSQNSVGSYQIFSTPPRNRVSCWRY